MTSRDLVRVGMGTASLWGSWKTPHPLLDGIDVTAVFTEDRSGSKAVVAVGDVCGMWTSTCTRLRRLIARHVGTPPDAVGVFCTQNHGAPPEGPGVYDADLWSAAFLDAVDAARSAALPAVAAYVEVRPDPPGIFNRRKRTDDAGSFTFWYGFESLPGGKAGCARLLDAAVRGLYAGPEVAVRCTLPDDSDRLWPWPASVPPRSLDAVLDGPVDPLVQGLFFRAADGRPIGAIARWSAHPVTANAPGGHSGDYPYYVRRRLSRELGGTALFLTGPCGDQAPMVVEKSRALAESTGERIAGLLLEGLGQAQWKEPAVARAATRTVRLPLREDMPRTAEQAARDLQDARAVLARLRADTAPLGEVKRASERIERLRYLVDGDLSGWCGMSFAELSAATVRHPLFALRIGDVILAGLPGEPFHSFSLELRRRMPDQRLLVCEEANGYLSYVPPAAEYAQGGYGASAAILAPAAEEMLLSNVEALVRSMGGGGA